MTDTKKNILELRKALPGLKERIAAVAFMLVLSLVMISATSYAWYTMASAPEVSNVSTTVSANGNLEIALSDLDGLAPDSTKIGDSKKGVMESNLAWSNLLNLSGNYGIENLILRPATFTTSSKYFLSSVTYTDGGRVEGETTNFGFTQWTETDSTLGHHEFVVPSGPAYGVRAISSVGYSSAGQSLFLAKLELAKEKCKIATDGYQAVMTNSSYMDNIRDIVQIYLNYNMYDAMQEKIGSGGGLSDDSTISTVQIEKLYLIYNDLYSSAILPYGDALAFLANVQLSISGKEYTEYTRNTLLASTVSALKNNGVDLGDVFTTYKNLEARFKTDLGVLQTYVQKAQAGEKIELRNESELLNIVNHLLDIDSCIIDDDKMVSELMKSGSYALEFVTGLSDGKTIKITATKGDIKTFEDLTGSRLDVKLTGLSMKIRYIITLGGSNLTGHLTTDSRVNLYQGLIVNTMDMDITLAASMVAQDTYGMVLDLWFRTNAEDSVLTLDGLVSTETVYEQRMVVLSGESESRPVFVYNRITGEAVDGITPTEEVLVYRAEDGKYKRISDRKIVNKAVLETYTTDENGKPLVDENGNPTSYAVVVEKDPIKDEDVTAKMDSKVVVNGFSGSNRVYDDLYVNSGETSATQGSGSCFIFYADTPETATGSLEMLRNLKMAFVSSEGELLAEASFDVDMVFADSGKYVVPIYISDMGYEFTNSTGAKDVGIVKLDKNVATRISVVVYLEGTNLENSMAMSNGEIQGSLNLQFGSSQKLVALSNSELSMQTMSFSAEISENQFTYDGVAKNPTLTAYIEGLSIGEGTEVQAIFQRQINSTQGMRTTPVTLTYTSGTVWTGSCNFTLPGTYVLKSLWVGGIEYALPQSSWITVEVSGFALETVKFCSLEGEQLALTADNSVTRSVAVKFNSSVSPTRVSARIVSTDEKYISCDLSYDSTTRQWIGTAGFTTSGTYTIKYLVVGVGEGENYEEFYYELDEAFQSTLTAYLGLQAKVYLDNGSSDISFDYTGARTIGVKVQILTNAGTTMDSLPYDITLYYGKRGSSVSANGLQSSLVWKDGCYTGEFNVDKVGIFNFTKLVVGNNVITASTGSPSIAARSMEPPVYFGTTSLESYVVNTNNAVNFIANLTNSDGASSVIAVFTNSYTGKSYEVAVDKVDDTYHYFPVPAVEGSRHGVWTISEILVDGVYDPQGNYYGTDDENAVAPYYRLSVGHQMKVFEGFVMEINSATSSGTDFMVEVDLGKYTDSGDGLWISIGERHGLSMADMGLTISRVELVLKHNGDSLAKGGYTISGTFNHQNISYSWGTPALGKLYIPEGGLKTGLAGSYVGTIRVIMSDGSIFEYSKNNAFILNSSTPSVKITSAYYASESSDDAAPVTNTSTTVYFRKYTASGCNDEIKYKQPYVTINLSGYGVAASAKIKFTTNNDAGVYMYNNSTPVDTYEWTGNGDVTRYVGRLYPGDTDMEPAKTLTGSTLELKDAAGNTYIVDIADITINNPPSESN